MSDRPNGVPGVENPNVICHRKIATYDPFCHHFSPVFWCQSNEIFAETHLSVNAQVKRDDFQPDQVPNHPCDRGKSWYLQGLNHSNRMQTFDFWNVSMKEFPLLIMV